MEIFVIILVAILVLIFLAISVKWILMVNKAFSRKDK